MPEAWRRTGCRAAFIRPAAVGGLKPALQMTGKPAGGGLKPALRMTGKG